ncbi:hypothetical protein ACMGDH_01890 [Sphingomonas sp. DT-207]|uniref:hypothetical protein n=1 Tax=Sphingomonas sp. DT-207 TaxID=3396167 RepID=UPI003F1E0BE5
MTVAPHDAIVVERPEGSTGLPPFPVSTAERAIETLSRFAGPLVFFLALGGIGWLIAN